jgi:hypothetical protein
MPARTPNLSHMTDLERFFRRLVDNLIAIDHTRLHRPLTLGELVESVVPYRTNRRSLSIDTYEDYDMVLLRLASGEGGFLRMTSDGVQAQFQAEAESHNPNLGLIRELAGAEFVLGTEPLAHAMGPDPTLAYAPPEEEEFLDEPETPQHVPERVSERGPERIPEEMPLDAMRFSSFTLEPVQQPEPAIPTASPPPRSATPAPAPRQPAREPAPRCGFCGGGLPVNRAVNFCPHCGQNQTFTRCPDCQSELELGWRHCINCGHLVGE